MTITIKPYTKCRTENFVKFDSLKEFGEWRDERAESDENTYHEVITGRVRPYFDFEVDFESEDEFNKMRGGLLTAAQDEIRRAYRKKGEVLSLDSSGKTKDKWRVSGRFFVRGAGYYANPKHMKSVAKGFRTKGFDTGVYHNDKTMRCAYCTKEGENRILQRAHIEDGQVRLLTELQAGTLLGETFEDWLVCDTKEKKCLSPADEEESESEDEAETGYKRAPMTKEQIQRYMDALNGDRSSTRNSRRVGIMALKQLDEYQKMDLRQFAHDFAMRAGDGYDEAKVDDLYSNPGKNPFTFNVIIGWARKDCPDLDEAEAPKEIVPTFYEEKFALLETKPSIADVQMWMKGCLAFVLQSEQWYLRYQHGWKQLPKCPKRFPFSNASSSSSIMVPGLKGKMVGKAFADILAELKDQPDFEPCRYTREEYLPYFKEKPLKIFNTFEGWIHDFAPEPIRDDDPDVKGINEHLFDLCGRSKELLEYNQKWYAMSIQQPQRKMPAQVYYSLKQGTGKSMWFGFLEEHLYGEKQVMKVTDMRIVVGHFNAATSSNQMIVCEEAKAEGGSVSDWQVMKDIIMGNKRQTTVKKGCEAEKTSNYNKFIFGTNNKSAIQMEASDRRFVCNECSCEHVGDFDYFKRLATTLGSKAAGSKYFNWLAQMDLSKFVPETIPMSKMKEDLKEKFMSTSFQHVQAVCEGRRSFGKLGKDGLVITAKELYSDYRTWCEEQGYQAKFTKILKYYGEDLVTLGMKKPAKHYIDEGRVTGWMFEFDQMDQLFQAHLGLKRSIFVMEGDE